MFFLLTVLIFLGGIFRASIIIDIDDKRTVFCENIDNLKVCLIEKQTINFKKQTKIYSDNPADGFRLVLQLCDIKSSSSDSLIEIAYGRVMITDTQIRTDIIRVLNTSSLIVARTSLNFNRLMLMKINEIEISESSLISTFKVTVSSYDDLQPNFFSQSSILNNPDIDMLKIIDYVDATSPTFINANNVFISGKDVLIHRSQISGSVIYFVANKLSVKASLIDARIYRKTNANSEYFVFDNSCGEEGGGAYNRGGFGLPITAKDVDIYSHLCFQRSIMISRHIEYTSMLDIFSSGSMGTFFNDDIIDVNYGGVIALTANSLSVCNKSVLKVVGNNIYNKEFNQMNYGGSAGGSIGVITTEPAVLNGVFDLKGENSLNHVNGEGAGGVFFYTNPNWRTAKQITNGSNLTGIDLRAGDRPFIVSGLDKATFEGLRADNGTFVSTPCAYSGTSVFCSPCSESFWNPLLLNMDCLQCGQPNDGVNFIDNECKSYICKNDFINRNYNPHCLSGFPYMLYFVNNNVDMIKTSHVALFLVFVLGNFVFYINKYGNRTRNIKKINNISSGMNQEWVHIWLSGINEPEQPWHICIHNYEKNISELRNGPVLLNVFRNLNKFFEWSLKNRILYRFFNTTTFFLAYYMRYKLKRRIFRKAVSYLRSLEDSEGLLFKTLYVKLESDRNFNNCLIKVADPETHENSSKSFILFLDRRSNFNYVKENKLDQLVNFLFLYRDLPYLCKNYFLVEFACRQIEILTKQLNPYKSSDYNQLLITKAMLLVKKINLILTTDDGGSTIRGGLLVKYQSKGTFNLTFMDSIEKPHTTQILRYLKDERKAKKNKLAFAFVLYLQDVRIRPIPMIQTLSTDINNKVYSITLFDQMLTKTKKKPADGRITLVAKIRGIYKDISSLLTSSSEYRGSTISQVFFDILLLEMSFIDVVS